LLPVPTRLAFAGKEPAYVKCSARAPTLNNFGGNSEFRELENIYLLLI